MDQIITVPFGYLLDWLYQFTANYGVALIIFSFFVQLVLVPINAKSKKSMMKMSRLQPKIQEIKNKYANDQQKQNEAIQQLQKEEGASMGCGGCLWSLVPMFILIPLYSVVRQPLVYMLHMSEEVAASVVEVIKTADPSLFSNSNFYDQITAARHLPAFVEQITAKLPDLDPAVLTGVNFDFLGIDLGAIPQYNIFDATLWAWDWAHIGALLIPLLSAGSQVLSMWLSQRRNDTLVTDEKGLQDKETAKKSDSAQTSKMMMFTMPLMSLWIGFTVPAALSLYWFIGGVLRMIEDPIMTARSTTPRTLSACSAHWKPTALRPRRSASGPSVGLPTPRVRPRIPARRSCRSSSSWPKRPLRPPQPRNTMPRRALWRKRKLPTVCPEFRRVPTARAVPTTRTVTVPTPRRNKEYGKDHYYHRQYH